MSSWSLIDAGAAQQDFRLDAQGFLVIDDTPATEMVTALLDEEGRYWADPVHGSSIAEVLRRGGVPDAPLSVARAAERALLPMQRDEQLGSVEAMATLDRNCAVVRVVVVDTKRQARIEVSLEVVL
ncbi:MAG: hypothetical protein ACPGVG_00345 [Mycobacterium sp.]